MADVFDLGAREAMTKIAVWENARRAVSVAAGLKASTRVAKKPPLKKPSRKLGLGEETMDMGSMTLGKKLQQPPRPPRY